MKVVTSIARLLATALLLGGPASTALAADISIRLENAPSSGAVTFALFDSASTFGDFRNPAELVTFQLDGRQTYQLSDVPAGEYALMVYYDENNNLKMDKNFIGIPTEPLGFSNNYEPKGPPSYSKAAFTLSEEEQREFTVALKRPLGERGRFGVGVGVIGRSSPYRDYNGSVTQIIPAISYNGDRLQILGPNIQYSLAGTGKVRLAAAGTYRMGAYEEDDSDYLAGLGDRDATFMAGLALQAELPEGFELSLSYKHDVLDNIGGGEARIAIDKSFPLGTLRLSPVLGINWISADLADYDFGVPKNKAVAGRPAYDLDSAFSVDVGVGARYELTTRWLVVMNVAAEFYDHGITDSPIVDKDYVIKGFFAVNYLF